MATMATLHSQNGDNNICSSNTDLLLHPELLSKEYMQSVLSERNVCTRDRDSRDQLTELYLRHVMPLPQRILPNTRWGRSMQKIRGRQTSSEHMSERSGNNQTRKRPLITFDGTSHSGTLKVKKPEITMLSPGVTNRLKPPPAANLSNPIRRLSGSTSLSSTHQSTDKTNFNQESSTPASVKSPEVKKKIQHITWP